jgi:hypothetical protein
MSEVAQASPPISAPGIYEIPENAYHADPCPAPSLSRSVLRLLVRRSEKHAYTAHPKLGGLDEPDDSGDEVADYGTAAHQSFLQNRSNIKQLDFKDWKTNAAKAAREQAYADGKIPLLTKSYNRCMRLIDVLEDFRARTGAFTKGKPEQTVVWQEGSIWCRARVDWLPDDEEAHVWDLKTTAGSAVLGAWSRVAFDKGYDLQDSFYCRGLEIVRGVPPQPMKFCVVEQRPPFGIAVFEMSPIARELADEDVRNGIDLWTDALASGEFPAYPWETQLIDPPPWVVRDRQNRSMISPRNVDLLRGREHPNAVRYVETGNFGG